MPSAENTSYNAYRRFSETNYQKITVETRMQLIKLVAQQNFSVYRASKILNINNSTAKAILRKYRATGHIFVRKAEKFQTQNEPENPNEIEDGQQLQEQRTRTFRSVSLQPEIPVPLINPYWFYWRPEAPYFQPPHCYLIPFS